MNKDIEAIVVKIIDNYEQMKREDGHDMDERSICEDNMIEAIVEYIEKSECSGPALSLMIGVRKKLIEEGYTFLY